MEGSSSTVLEPLARVSEQHGSNELALRLLELRTWLASDLQELEQALAIMDGAGSAGIIRDLPGMRVRGAAEHLLSLAGKRIRPLCVLLAARLGGREFDKSLRDVAVACELVHAATLLHDDVIDYSSERRGAPAARVLYGNAASILAGDHLLVEALRLVQRHSQQSDHLLAGLLDVIAQMVASEALQLERRGRFDPDREIYLNVIRGKTAALFAWGLAAGGALAGLDGQSVEALTQVGVDLGMAFQLVDDVLDLTGDAETIGKETFVDLREGKLTWPVIVASERDASLRDELAAMASLSGAEVDTAAARQLVVRLKDTGALAATRAFALKKAEDACGRLHTLPSGQARDALMLVVESAVHRAR